MTRRTLPVVQRVRRLLSSRLQRFGEVRDGC